MNSKIVFDTDCICSFLWTNSVDLIIELYPQRLVISDMALNEIKKLEKSVQAGFLWRDISKYISNGNFEIFNIIVGDNATFNEYQRLISQPYAIGAGEAATIAIAKTVDGYTASNNLRDIRKFIELGEIQNITTVDILCDAYKRGIKTIEELEELRLKMIARRRKLPNKTITEILRETGTNI